MAHYEDIRPELQTGDIVLFSGKGNISAGIKWLTKSKWSHVGMVLCVPEWEAVLLWESTTLSNVVDIESGKARKGVQLVVLSDRLRVYNGEVQVRHLVVDRTPEMLESLKKLRNEVRNRPYETSEIELLKAAYEGPFGTNKEDLSSLFCSELVAEAYQRMGLLPGSPASNEYTPRDFSSQAPSGALKLLHGAELTSEITITK